MKPTKYLPILAASLIPATNAAVVFTDDFETPDVTAADSNGNTSGEINTSNWVRATNGFGATRQGTVDEAHGDFSDPVGEQAYAFRYTNSGITTAVGTVGSLATGQTITVTFDVVLDGHNSGTPYSAYLTTFSGGTRNTMNTGGFGGADVGTTSVLAGATGSYSGTTYNEISFSYTVGDAVIDSDGGTGGVNTTFDSAVLGHDIALRFVGATNTAIIDNVTVDVAVVPEPAAALLGSLGFLGLLRRRH